jgi:photosystem II stability/assembly factor-like uncharacterized protein
VNEYYRVGAILLTLPILALGISFAQGEQEYGWQVVESPVSNDLNSVYMLSSNEGWAVGYHTILRWNGEKWLEFESPQVNFKSVYMLSPNEGWAAGSAYEKNVVYYWDGSDWQEFATLPFWFNSIYILSSSEGWAVSNYGVIYRWDGNNWSEVRAAAINQKDLNSVYMLSSTEGWAVGGGIGQSGILLRWNGDVWQEVEAPQELPGLNSVYMLSSSEGWAVGGGTILRWNGSVWQKVEVPRGVLGLESIYMLSSNYGWAVGWDILKWDGSNWTKVKSPKFPKPLNSVYILSENEGWAVGHTGTILRYAPVEPRTQGTGTTYNQLFLWLILALLVGVVTLGTIILIIKRRGGEEFEARQSSARELSQRLPLASHQHFPDKIDF